MWQIAIEVGLLAADYIYHRLTEPGPPTQKPQEISLPITNGSPALLFGKFRVRAPILAWAGLPSITGVPADVYGGAFIYGCSMHFLIALGFTDGINTLDGYGPAGGARTPLGIFIGEKKMWYFASDNSAGIETDATGTLASSVGGYVEFLDGDSSQTIVDTIGGVTFLGRYMVANGDAVTQIPGYRGYLGVFLHGDNNIPLGTSPPTAWNIGTATQLPAYSFEVASYPATFFSTTGNVGDDANPVDVIYDILCGTFGKLNISPSSIDGPSFYQAAHTLDSENHGFSRSWEGMIAAQEMINEILRQIDATIYRDESTGKIKIKLIRADYDVGTIPMIQPGNCVELQSFAAGGWTDVPNKITVTYSNRADGYRDAQGSSASQGNAVGQDGAVREIVLQMPGVTSEVLANTIAARELQARSRPLMKCRAIVNRSMLRVNPGDAVLLTWPEANISHIVMRVAAVGRGTRDDGKIALDLIQDYFYQWRRLPPVSHLPVHLGPLVDSSP